jgi:hypothetical protein
LDDKKAKRLSTRDASFTVEAFAARARSALYLREHDTQPLHTHEAFAHWASRFPSAGKHWLERLRTIGDAELGILVDDVPPQRITSISAEFAKRLILENRRALIAMTESL